MDASCDSQNGYSLIICVDWFFRYLLFSKGINMDRLQAMTVFVKVVEVGSFSGAARLLNVGQPSVSKVIAQLEAHLGTALLLRSTHGLTPTDAGQRYYERAARIIEDAREADSLARGSGKELSGRLRIAIPTTFGRIHLVPQLGQFTARYPGLELDVQMDDRRVDLISEGIDMAVRIGRPEDTAVIGRRLARGRRSVMASPAYLEKFAAPSAPADLENHQMVLYAQGRQLRTAFTRDNDSQEVSLRSGLRLSAAEGIRAAVLSGQGMTIAADWMFAPELAVGDVQRCLPDWSLEAVELWLLFPAGRMVSAKVRAMADFVTEIVDGLQKA